MRDLARAALAAIALWLLYFYNLAGTGLLGPDEPRYAAIGRDMFLSEDWLTPVLWGEPWFEKPPLEYWGIALAHLLGVPDALAPRLFNALLAAAGCLFFFHALRRRFDPQLAWTATAILATSAAWVAEARIAVMDMPLAATLTASLLSALNGWWLAAGLLLGLAILAKGPVAVVLALPAVWYFRAEWRRASLGVLVALAVAQPWFIAMSVTHGAAFLQEFFVKHHLSRYTEEALQHVQPVWFFVPVLMAGLFPWTPLVAWLRWPGPDRARRFFWAWLLWGLLFFSLSRNKLPGYALPLLPPLAVLLALGIRESRRPWLAASLCGALLGLTALLPDLLPEALARGLGRSSVRIPWVSVLLMSLGGSVIGAWQSWRAVAVMTVAIVPLLADRLSPELDHRVSARPLWQRIESRRTQVCVDRMHRAWRYGLNYYSVEPLPDCTAQARPLRIIQQGSQPPQIQGELEIAFPAPGATGDPGGALPPP